VHPGACAAADAPSRWCRAWPGSIRLSPVSVAYSGYERPYPQDKALIAEQLKAVINADRFPLSPRIKSLKAVLDKLEPPKPRPAPLPPMKPPGEPSMVVARMRGTKRRR
jgi:hypothetical protein